MGSSESLSTRQKDEDDVDVGLLTTEVTCAVSSNIILQFQIFYCLWILIAHPVPIIIPVGPLGYFFNVYSLY